MDNRIPLNHKGIKIILACIALSLWGCLAVYNTGFQQENPLHFLQRQMLWLAIVATPSFLIAHIPVERIVKSLPYLGILALIGLTGLFFGGETINGMRGWYNLGHFQIQPSELAKPVFCLGLGFCLYKKPRSRGFVWGTTWLISFIVLIALQPDFGSLIVYVLTFLFFYIYNGGKKRYISLAAIPCIGATIWAFNHYAYIRRRIDGFLFPEENTLGSSYHIIQVKKALAHGDWSGQPYGRSFISEVYVPLSRNDSIFALLGENEGFIRMLLLVGIFLGGLIYLLKNKQPQNSFQSFAISALSLQIATQAFLHISVNLGLLPMTGITLPFFSYGGSSLSASMINMAFIAALMKKETPLIQASSQTSQCTTNSGSTLKYTENMLD